MSKMHVLAVLAGLAGGAFLISLPWSATAQAPKPVSGFTIASGSGNSAWIVSSTGVVTYCTVATGSECVKVGQAAPAPAE